MKPYKHYLTIGLFLMIGCRLFGQTDTPPYGTTLIPGSNNLYLFSYDEPEKLNRPDAVCACQNKGNGWRLPTLNELQVIASQNVGLTAGNTYWTMDKVVGKLEFYAVSSNGKVKKCSYSDKNAIRCVWSPNVAAPDPKPVEAVQKPVTKPVTEPSPKEPENNAVAVETPAPKSKEEPKSDNKTAEPQTKKKDEEKPAPTPKVKEEKEKPPKENKYVFSEKFPYKHSLGIVAGNINGISYKTFVRKHFAIELDLAGCEVSLCSFRDYYEYYDNYNYQSKYYEYIRTVSAMSGPVLHLNFLYQGHFTKGLYGMVGGGINIGYSFTPELRKAYRPNMYNNPYANWEEFGKAGAGALLGLEYVFEKPVALQFDFRPGYGILFSDLDYYNFFDWSLCLSVRYVFK